MYKKQISNSYFNSAIIALSGGVQDAYTYNVRGNVFANAQTGNIVLMFQDFMNGQNKIAVHYLIPIMAFVFGIFIAENIQYKYKFNKYLHWRQIIIFIEIFVLFIVGFLSSSFNLLVNSMISFSCALQVESFRTVRGFKYSSTMCIGNLRAGMDYLSKFIRHRRGDDLKAAINYFGIIVSFALGAGIGGILSHIFGIKTIWLSCLILSLSFILMFINFEKSVNDS